MRRGRFLLLALLFTLILAACGQVGAPATTAPTDAPVAEATIAPATEATVPAATEPTDAPVAEATIAPAAEATTAPATEETADTAAAPNEVFEVTYLQQSPWTREAPPEPDEDWVHDYIQDQYGIDLNLQVGPAEGADARLNAMMAAGELPDLIQGYYTVASPSLKQWIEQGVLVPVDEYLAELPTLKGTLTEAQWAYLRLNGQTWGVATPPDPNFDVVWIREDWLEKLGMEAPGTVEELATVGKAFASQDPDGNGQSDTYGFTAFVDDTGQWNGLESIFAPFGAYPSRNYIYAQDGVEFSAFSPQARDALAWWKDLIAANAVDPDWLTNKQENWRQAVAQGKVGIVTAQFQLLREFSGPSSLGIEIKEASPDARWVMLPALQGPAGTYAQWAKGSNNSFHLTRNAAENPEKARAIMRFLNDAMDPSSETYRTLIFGRPGEDYEVRDGKPYARTGNQPGWLSYYANTRIGNDEYWNVSWQKLFPDLPGKLKFSGSQPVLPHVTPLVAAPDAMPDLMNYVREMHAKFAVGDESLDTWDAFVETAMTQYSGQSVIEDVTAQLTELGLTK